MFQSRQQGVSISVFNNIHIFQVISARSSACVNLSLLAGICLILLRKFLKTFLLGTANL